MSEPLRIGVLGAGVMGSGIAQVTATAGFPTVCFDVDPGRARTGPGARHHRPVRAGAGRGAREAVARADADAALARLRFTDVFEDAADTDLVIEAVPERLALKVAVFRQLDACRAGGHDPGVEHVGVPDLGVGGRDGPAGRGGGLALGVAGAGDALRRDRAHPGGEPGDARHGVPGRDAVREVARSWSATATPRGGSSPTGSTSRWSPRPAGWSRTASRRAEEVDQLMRDCFGWPAGPFGMVQGASGGWS